MFEAWPPATRRSAMLTIVAFAGKSYSAACRFTASWRLRRYKENRRADETTPCCLSCAAMSFRLLPGATSTTAGAAGSRRSPKTSHAKDPQATTASTTRSSMQPAARRRTLAAVFDCKIAVENFYCRQLVHQAALLTAGQVEIAQLATGCCSCQALVLHDDRTGKDRAQGRHERVNPLGRGACGAVQPQRIAHHDHGCVAFARALQDRLDVAIARGMRDRLQRHRGHAGRFVNRQADAHAADVDGHDRAHARRAAERSNLLSAPPTANAFERRPSWYSTNACVALCTRASTRGCGPGSDCTMAAMDCVRAARSAAKSRALMGKSPRASLLSPEARISRRQVLQSKPPACGESSARPPCSGRWPKAAPQRAQASSSGASPRAPNMRKSAAAMSRSRFTRPSASAACSSHNTA